MKKKISTEALLAIVMMVLGIITIFFKIQFNVEYLNGVGGFFFGYGLAGLIIVLRKGWFYD